VRLNGRKVVVVGLDSIAPPMVDRFLAEGRMPNLARLRAEGFWTEVKPTMPPTTSAGWTTVATGAWPSTHGIEGFAVHRPGDPLDRKTHSLTTEHVRSEQIWKVAEQAGLETVLLKYPVSWPPTGGTRVTQVDGAGGWGGLKCVFDLVHSGCWDTQPEPPRGADERRVGPRDWMTRDADNLDEEATQRIQLRAPAPWRGVPAGFEPAWEAELQLASRGRGAASVHVLGGRWRASDAVLVAADRDASGLEPLSAGGWSAWARLRFAAPAGPRHGAARFKVMALDVAAGRLRLYQSQVHDEAGWTRPRDLAAELVDRIGPFVEWTESYDLLQGWIDHDTQLEIYEQHVAWMSAAARLLIRERPWHLFLTQLHIVDMAYHIYWGAVDPGHPQHDPAEAARYWDLLGRVHQLADEFLGAIVDEVDDDTLVVALGDHGQDLYRTALLANHVLLREGLLAVERDPRTGAARIDWRRSLAYALGYRVYLNVEGREPDGTVAAADVDAVARRIVEALYRVRDPETGAGPVRLALVREDAVALGLYGPTMGDVVFATAPGFQTRSTIQIPAAAWAGRRLLADRVPILKPTELFREFTGEHDNSLPWTRAIRTLLCLHGPGVRRGERRVPIDLVDVAPTLCRWLGLRPPEHCEGKPVEDAFVPGALAPPPEPAASPELARAPVVAGS
jgi:predicted AlkP superfamily phosphohydrolase/phosphomutase